MKTKDVFARFAGGTAGVVVAVSVPHIGCVAAITPLFIGAGSGVALAVTGTYVMGGVLVSGAVAAAWYGLRGARVACDQNCHEPTPPARLRRAAAIGLAAFAAVAAIQSARDTIPIKDRAEVLQKMRAQGWSVWQAQDAVKSICGVRP